MQTVWADTFVTDDVLTRSISELRKVFDDDKKNPRFIQTIPKGGYRLIAPVEEVKTPLPSVVPAVSPELSLDRSRHKRLPAILAGSLVLLVAVAYFVGRYNSTSVPVNRAIWRCCLFKT